LKSEQLNLSISEIEGHCKNIIFVKLSHWSTSKCLLETKRLRVLQSDYFIIFRKDQIG